MTGLRSYDSYSDVSSCADASEIIEAMSAMGDSEYLSHEVVVSHVGLGVLDVKSEGEDLHVHPTLGVHPTLSVAPNLVPPDLAISPGTNLQPGTMTLELLAASLHLDAPA